MRKTAKQLTDYPQYGTWRIVHGPDGGQAWVRPCSIASQPQWHSGPPQMHYQRQVPTPVQRFVRNVMCTIILLLVITLFVAAK